MPWYGYPPIVCGAMTGEIRDGLAGLGLSPLYLVLCTFSIVIFGSYLVFRAGKWLSHRFRALESDREDIDIFGRPDP